MLSSSFSHPYFSATVMSAHRTKSSIKADSYLQNTDTFSSRHVHFIVSPQCPRAGLHRQPSHKYTTATYWDNSLTDIGCNFGWATLALQLCISFCRRLIPKVATIFCDSTWLLILVYHWKESKTCVLIFHQIFNFIHLSSAVSKTKFVVHNAYLGEENKSIKL